MNTDAQNNPLVTIVIPAYNEVKVIKDCIDSLREQTYKPFEIIVIDDGSKDRSKKILKRIRGIRLLSQEHLGPGAARNKGAMKARGEILVFVDADMTFDKRFIDRLTLPIREGKAIGTFSKEEYVANNDSRWARNWSLNLGWESGRMHPKKYPKKQKVFRAILKEKFDSVNGFDTDIGYTDDWTLAKKLKTQAIQAKGAVFFHKNPDSLKEAFKQMSWVVKRPYKLGIIGRTIALLRVSLPLSLIIGIIKAVRYRKPSFFLFKIIIDTAAFLGILSMFIRSKRVK
jgi:glycosyltransferase involved in cell wall biosynthesis